MDKREFLLQIIENVERRHKRFDSEIERFFSAVNEKKHLCSFGCGMILSEVIAFSREKGMKIDFLCDNDPEKYGKKFFGIECISYEELKKIKDDTVIYISSSYFAEIEKQLKEDGFNDYFTFFGRFFHNPDIKAIFNESKKDIITAYDLLSDDISKQIYMAHILHASDFLYYSIFNKLPYSDNQYFDSDIVKLNENEVYVDCGAYDGVACFRFIKQIGGKFNKIYNFELSKDNADLLYNNIMKLEPPIRERIICVNKGVYDENISVSIDEADMKTNIRIMNNGTGKDSTETVRLDDFFTADTPTMVSMDIEGAELNALKGMRGIITEHTPKLAICTYHNIRDLWEIPLLINEFNNNYKFHFRHHCNRSPHETVCYAIPKGE